MATQKDCGNDRASSMGRQSRRTPLLTSAEGHKIRASFQGLHKAAVASPQKQQNPACLTNNLRSEVLADMTNKVYGLAVNLDCSSNWPFKRMS